MTGRRRLREVPSADRGAAGIREQRIVVGGIGSRSLEVPGSGPTVVLLHGFSDTADTWRGVLAELSSHGRHAVAVDLPGFGSADRLTPGAVLGQLDAFVRGLIDECGRDGVVLVGNSLGGVVALRAAQESGRRVLGVVAIGSPAYGLRLPARAMRHALSLRVLPKLLAGAPPQLLTRTGRAVYTLGLHGRLRSPTPEHVHLLREQLRDREFLTGMSAIATALGPELVGCVHPDRVSAPVVVMHGRRDVFVSVKSARLLAHRLSEASLMLLDDIGHCAQLEAADTVAEQIESLVEIRA